MKKRRFKHLSWTDRLKIETMLKDKRHKQEIADEIGVHLKTIYNEIKRGRYIHTNSDLTEEERYSPEMAEAAYREHLAAYRYHFLTHSKPATHLRALAHLDLPALKAGMPPVLQRVLQHIELQLSGLF